MHPLFKRANELSREVIGAAVEVHRLKGASLFKGIYENRLMRELALRNLTCVNQRIVKNRMQGDYFRRAFAIRRFGRGVTAVGVKVRPRNPARSQGAALELYEAARHSGWAYLQLPRSKTDGWLVPDDSAGGEPMNSQQKQTKGTKKQTVSSPFLCCLRYLL